MQTYFRNCSEPRNVRPAETGAFIEVSGDTSAVGSSLQGGSSAAHTGCPLASASAVACCNSFMRVSCSTRRLVLNLKQCAAGAPNVMFSKVTASAKLCCSETRINCVCRLIGMQRSTLSFL